MQYMHDHVGKKLTDQSYSLKKKQFIWKLNTIKSVKAFDVFPFSDKIIRIPVSYYAIANHWDLRVSPSFFSFMIFYNLSLCLCPVNHAW